MSSTDIGFGGFQHSIGASYEQEVYDECACCKLRLDTANQSTHTL